jgi:hypothetical protein
MPDRVGDQPVHVLQPVQPQARAGQHPAGQARPQTRLLLSLGRDTRPGLRGRHEPPGCSFLSMAVVPRGRRGPDPGRRPRP